MPSKTPGEATPSPKLQRVFQTRLRLLELLSRIRERKRNLKKLPPASRQTVQGLGANPQPGQASPYRT